MSILKSSHLLGFDLLDNPRRFRLSHDVDHRIGLGLSGRVLHQQRVLAVVLVFGLDDPQSGDDAQSVLGLLLRDDDPLSVGLDLLSFEKPDDGRRRRSVDLGGQDELAALLDLLHLREVGGHGRFDL